MKLHFPSADNYSNRDEHFSWPTLQFAEGRHIVDKFFSKYFSVSIGGCFSKQQTPFLETSYVTPEQSISFTHIGVSIVLKKIWRCS